MSVIDDPKLKEIAQKIERVEKTVDSLNQKLEQIRKKFEQKARDLDRDKEREEQGVQNEIERETRTKAQLLADHTKRSAEIEKLNRETK